METLDHLLLGDVPPVDLLKIHVQGESWRSAWDLGWGVGNTTWCIIYIYYVYIVYIYIYIYILCIYIYIYFSMSHYYTRISHIRSYNCF